MVSDGDLYGRWQARRDADAFAELVARHGGMVYGVCRRVLRNEAEAEDVAQQCFVELAESRTSIRQSLTAWLHAMAVHRSLDRIRAESRRRLREARYAESRSEATETVSGDWVALVDEAIVRLPEELRAAIIHRFLEGRTQQETADLLGVSRSTAQYRLDKGVEGIRRHLRRQGVPALVAASALAEGLAEAAPASLTAALGKVAVAGGVTLASAKTVGTFALGGVVMTVNKVAIAAAIAIAVAGVLYGISSSRPEATTATPAATGETGSARSVAAGAADDSAAHNDSPGAVAPLDREPRAQAVPAAVPAESPAVESGETLTLSGRVFTEGKRGPAAGAHLALMKNDHRQTKPDSVSTTDVEGRFVFDNLSAGKYHVTARGADGGWAQALEVPAGTDGLALTLAATGRISGRAYDQETGEGVPGLQVLGVPVDSAVPKTAALGLLLTQDFSTDTKGLYSIEVPAPGEYQVVVPRADPYIDEGWQTRPPVRLEARRHAEGVDIGLRRGLVMEGVVYGASGAPVPTAEVQLLNQTRGSSSAESATTTDEQGRYRFSAALAGQAYVVRAAHPDHGAVESPSVTLSPGEGRSDVDLRFAEGHEVYGAVVTSDGKGVPGLRVSVAGAREGDFVAVPHMEASTMEGGRFAIGPLPGGEYAIAVVLGQGTTPQATATFRSTPFTMPPETDLRGLRIDIGPAIEGSIAGRLTGPEGEPVVGATVGAHSPNAHCFAQSDANGAYRIEHLGGSPTWAIEVFSTPEYAHGAQHGVPVDSENVDFSLRRLGSVSGAVVDEETGGAIVRFEVREGQGRWTPFAASDGVFTLTGIEGEETVLEVRAEGYVTATTPLIPLDERGMAEGVRVALKPGEGIQGVVVDASTGQPLEGARVRVFTGDPRSGWYAQGRGWSDRDPVTDSQGAFQLYGLTPGEPANLLAWREGYAPAVVMDSVEGTVTIALGTGGSIQGTVTRRGAPVPGVRLSTERRAPDDGLPHGAFGGTDPQGRFKITHLPPGEYQVICVGDPQAPEPLWVGEAVVEEGKTTEVRIAVGAKPQG